MRIQFLILVLILELFSSCSTTNKESTDLKKNIDIKVQVLRKTLDTWKVSYQLDKPVYALKFLRQTNTFRHKNWAMLSPDLEIKLIYGQEYIVSKNKTPFQKAVLEHQSYFDHTPKDYEFFIKYSDNNILMYTGHYNIVPITRLEDIKSQFKPHYYKITFDLINLKNSQLLFDGSVFKSQKAQWVDKDLQGTYIFWGRGSFLNTPSLVAIIDAATPAWIQKEMIARLPELFEYYSKKFQIPLGYKPTVYLNFQNKEGNFLGNSGGALPNLIQLTLIGEAWKKKEPSTLKHLYQFLAHESAHLWLGQKYENKNNGHDWLQEGGADFFSYKALKDQGLISKTSYLTYIRKASKRCLKEWDGSYPLYKSGEKRKFKNYYHCGSFVAYVSESILKNKNLFNFWRELFLASQKNLEKQNQFSDTLYFKKLENENQNEAIFLKVKQLVYEKNINPKFLIEDLAQFFSH